MANILYTVASTLLGGVGTQVVLTSAGLPPKARMCVVPGQLAWDDCECGLLAVEFNGTAYSTQPPSPDLQREQCLPYVVATYTISMIRCVAGPQVAGRPPTCAQLDDAAQILFDDTLAMMKGTSLGLTLLYNSNVITGFAMSGVAPTGPQGLCVGITQQVNAYIPNMYGPC